MIKEGLPEAVTWKRRPCKQDLCLPGANRSAPRWDPGLALADVDDASLYPRAPVGLATQTKAILLPWRNAVMRTGVRSNSGELRGDP